MDLHSSYDNMGAVKVDNPVMMDVLQFHRRIREQGLMGQISDLKRPSLGKTLFSIAANWGVIYISLLLVVKGSIWWGLIAIPIIGSRQRGMSNLVHDASHGNLTKNRSLNNWLADLFAAFVMGETVNNYRKNHMRHHLNLGVPGLDPDLESHRQYGFDDHAPPENFSVGTYLRLVFNARSWRDSVTGPFLNLPLKEKAAVLAWWTFFLTCMGLFSHGLALLFVTVWLISRATSYHLIRIFAEFMDHAGLKPGSVFGFTRNIPFGAWPLRTLFHPHSDNFHLVHHLFPQIPHYHLSATHQILIEDQRYKMGHHCDGYFTGRYSAVRSWSKAGEVS